MRQVKSVRDIVSKFIHDLRTPILYVQQGAVTLREYIKNLDQSYSKSLENNLAQPINKVGDATTPLEILNKVYTQSTELTNLVDNFWEDINKIDGKAEIGKKTCLVCSSSEEIVISITSLLVAMNIDVCFEPALENTFACLSDSDFHFFVLSFELLLNMEESELSTLQELRKGGVKVFVYLTSETPEVTNCQALWVIDGVLRPPFNFDEVVILFRD